MEWREILDSYERHLDAVERALAGQGPWPGEFNQPLVASLIPHVLVPKAQGLMERTGRLAAQLRDQMNVCQSVLSQSRARGETDRIVLVDVRA
ncbi:MAG: hypothetical protein ACP5O0_00480 [Acidimicrobiales bacterium]